MSVTYLCPESWENLGDRVILQGLQRTYGQGRIVHLTDNIEPHETDTLVLAGTPWLWDSCEQSTTWQRLVMALDNINAKERHAIGIGSCYPLAWCNERQLALQHESTNAAIKEVFGRFDKVTVREDVARYVLQALDVPCTLAPCPSYQCFKACGCRQGKGYVLAGIGDIREGIGKGTFSETFLEGWEGYAKALVDDYKPTRLLAITEADRTFMGGEIVTSLPRLQAVLRGCSLLITTRVHVAIPALTLGKKVVLIGFDSRHLTVRKPTTLLLYAR